MFTTATPVSNPSAIRPVSASSRLEQLLLHEAGLPHGAAAQLAGHLATIEAMEARLGTPEIQIDEFEELVRNCHTLINEAQKLHLSSHLRNASVAPF